MSDVTGNNTEREDAATKQRNEQVTISSGTWSQIGIVMALIGLSIILVVFEFGLTWLLITSAILLWIGSSIKDSPIAKKIGYVPQIISAYGVIVFVSAFLSSGLIQWTVDKFDGWDNAASCAVNPAELKCVALEEERQRLADLERQESRRNTRRRTAPVVNYPIISQCDGAYALTTNCKKVTFNKEAVYQREVTSGMCIANNGKDAIDGTPLGGYEWAYQSNFNGVITVYFHDIHKGTSFDGAKCI
jgi:hypothetical protein